MVSGNLAVYLVYDYVNKEIFKPSIDFRMF